MAVPAANRPQHSSMLLLPLKKKIRALPVSLANFSAIASLVPCRLGQLHSSPLSGPLLVLTTLHWAQLQGWGLSLTVHHSLHERLLFALFGHSQASISPLSLSLPLGICSQTNSYSNNLWPWHLIQHSHSICMLKDLIVIIVFWMGKDTFIQRLHCKNHGTKSTGRVLCRNATIPPNKKDTIAFKKPH